MTEETEVMVRVKDLAWHHYCDEGTCYALPSGEIAAETRLDVARRLIESIREQAESREDSALDWHCTDILATMDKLRSAVIATREAELSR